MKTRTKTAIKPEVENITTAMMEEILTKEVTNAVETAVMPTIRKFKRRIRSLQLGTTSL